MAALATAVGQYLSPTASNSDLSYPAMAVSFFVCGFGNILNDLCDLSSEEKSIIRKQGMQYFAKNNYMIADEIKSPAKRFIAYLIIYKKFKVFKKLKVPSIAVILSHTPLYYPLRFIKKKIS